MAWRWTRHPEEQKRPAPIGGDLLTLRAALDLVPFGIVLLDTELRAQFINRAFRKMFRLPDTKADSKPAFVALMYHGRDTRAYAIPASKLDAYVAERVAQVKAGDPAPRDLRLASGEVIRFQCTVLPAGGRMLSYTYVTDIVNHFSELEVLRSALDRVDQGITLLDSDLTVRFMNRSVRRLWKVSDDLIDGKPAYADLINDSRRTNAYEVPPDQLDGHIARRIAVAQTGDPTPEDLRVSGGRIIRSQCTVLPSGGRMLTYTDVTDLVQHAEQLETLATTDGMTGLANRRHFLARAEAEWTRFQRYHRPLSLMVFDLDHLKSINDGFGHDVGDRALERVADLSVEGKRSPDLVARTGGDEFAALLPETDLAQAKTVAERLRRAVAASPIVIGDARIALTVSIGLAEATLSMPGADALMKLADQSLYQAKSAGRNRIGSGIAKPITGYNLAAE